MLIEARVTTKPNRWWSGA